jgi:hypothetical protein
MWFKRENKNRNRRVGRGHVLDVKLRSDQIRATRMRLMSIACAVVFGTVFGLYLIWRTGELALDKFVYENPDFAIQNVEVHTDGVIAPQQLRRWSGVRIGSNLITLDLAAVKRNLELVSAIDSVSVERVLPQTLKIRVTEYFCPADFTDVIAKKIQAAALNAFKAVGGRDYARVDVMVRADGSPVVLEVNTLPGMTETSLLPKAAAAAGLDYAALCQRMVDLALRRN